MLFQITSPPQKKTQQNKTNQTKKKKQPVKTKISIVQKYAVHLVAR